MKGGDKPVAQTLGVAMPQQRLLDLRQRVSRLPDQAGVLQRIATVGQARSGTVVHDHRQPSQNPRVARIGKYVNSLDTRMRGLYEHAATARSWDDDDLADFAAELAGMAEAHEIIIVYLDEQDGGGQGGTTSADCRRLYDACVNTECGPGGDGGLVCVCCTPCSLEYIGCMRRVITGLMRGAGGTTHNDPGNPDPVRRTP